MNEWKKAFGESAEPVVFLADANGAFTEALGESFDATAVLGSKRSKRYAILAEDGKVLETFVEPDNVGLTVSKAENVLSKL